EVVHQPELIVCVGVPGPLDLQRAGGLPVVTVAQIHRDAAELVLELLHRVEGRSARPPRDRGVETVARDQQQREPGADFFVMDADVARFVERHGAVLVVSRVADTLPLRSLEREGAAAPGASRDFAGTSLDSRADRSVPSAPEG